MKLSDYIGPALLSLIGLWWVLFPESFCVIYVRIHDNPRQLPTPSLMRKLGLLWIVGVVLIALIASLDCVALLHTVFLATGAPACSRRAKLAILERRRRAGNRELYP